MNALCFVLQQKVSMQWTRQLVVKTGTPPDGGVDGSSPGGSNFVSGGSSPPLRGGWINPFELRKISHMAKKARWVGVGTQQPRAGVEPATSRSQSPDSYHSATGISDILTQCFLHRLSKGGLQELPLNRWAFLTSCSLSRLNVKILQEHNR